MKAEGGCYCGAVRYAVDGEPIIKAQCHCRECQHISGGGPNIFFGIAESHFRYTKDQPKQFQRSDIAAPVTRDFCANCGTHLLTRTPGLPGVFIVKVGTLDDPDVYGVPQAAIHTLDKRAYHVVPEGVHAFERLPPR